MKKSIISIAIALTLTSGIANAFTQGNYTANESAQLTQQQKKMQYALAEAKIAAVNGDKMALEKASAKFEAEYVKSCAIYKKDAIDYTNAGCHKK
jgi:hypothetical protein